jgi:hypothetical protein
MSFTYITATSAITASINFQGYMMDKTTNVFLSSSTIRLSGTLTAINSFTTNALVSSIFPVVSGYNYPNFRLIDKNHLAVNIYGLSGTGFVDVIVYNQAGYTKLSDHNFLIRKI